MFYRCIGGGSGELHGANIIVDIEETELIGKDCVLTLNDKVVDVQVVTSAMSVLFSEIQEVGTYTITAIGDKSYSVTADVTAADIVNKNTITVIITSRVYLYRYGDECIDVTNGWVAYYSFSPTRYDDHWHFETAYTGSGFDIWQVNRAPNLVLQDKTLCMDCEILQVTAISGGTSQIALRPAISDPQLYLRQAEGRKTYKLPLPGYTGVKRPQIVFSGNMKVDIYRIWVE